METVFCVTSEDVLNILNPKINGLSSIQTQDIINEIKESLYIPIDFYIEAAIELALHKKAIK